MVRLHLTLGAPIEELAHSVEERAKLSFSQSATPQIQAQSSPQHGIVFLKSYRLANGKLSPIGDMPYTKRMFDGWDLSELATIEVETNQTRYLVDRSQNDAVSGKYLIDIDGRLSINSIQRLPNKLAIAFGDSTMEVSEEDIKVVGRLDVVLEKVKTSLIFNIYVSEKMNIPNTLKTKIQQGRLIPVVCAGVSMAIKDNEGQAVFPSWPTLLEKAAEEALKESKEKKANAISALVEIEELQQAAELAKKSLIGENWNRFLEEQFDVNLDKLDSSSSSLQKALWNLSHRHITLNYDQCLEWAHDSQANYTSFDNSNKSQLRNFKINNSSKDLIWHLHGTIKNPEHMVLTPQSYERLYGEGGENEYSAALSALKDVMSSDSLLFVGSSMSDVELLAELGKQNQLFSGNTGPHYVLVREEQKSSTEKALDELLDVIEVLTFSDFGAPLVEVVEELASHSPQKKKLADTLHGGNSISQPSETRTSFDSVSIHLANPIDKPHDYDHLTKFTKGFKCHVEKHYLSSDSLWNESDYTFIFTSLTKNGFLIEDESCCSDYLSVEDLLDELPIDTKGVFIFVDNIPNSINEETITEQTELPVAIYQLSGDSKQKKRIVDKVAHQLFRKHVLKLTSSCILANQERFELEADLSGKHIVASNFTKKMTNIDKSSVAKFIGRTSDLATISREISRIEDKTLALVLKGSGGVGKTTIAKKLAIELSMRGKYEDGITFIDCEPITAYDEFYQKISEGFFLSSVVNLKEHLSENNFSNNRLIILDNYESILNLDIGNEKFLELTGNISEYCSLIITSRESCQEQWEQELSLRSLDSYEALELFNNHTKNLYSNTKFQSFIREEIIEKLLDRNPLAIELVASNTPPGKDIYELRDTLVTEFESIENSTYLKSKSDSNIGRKDSLIGSINYSYKTLNETEKRAIELISLFPDGISLKNLKELTKHGKSKVDTKTIISDKSIKILSDKSLLVSSNDEIKLHSIVSRFILLKARKNEANHPYWQKIAFFNMSFMDTITSIGERSEYVEAHLVLTYLNNLLVTVETFEYLDFNNIDKDEYFSYIYQTVRYSARLNISNRVKNAIESLVIQSKSIDLEEKYKKLLEICLLNIEHRIGWHFEAYEKLKNILPIEDLEPKQDLGLIEQLSQGLAMSIYRFDGHIKEAYEYTIKSEIYGRYYPESFVFAGVFSEKLLNFCNLDTDYFEVKSILGLLDKEELVQHINNLHPQENVERLQLSYILNSICPLTEPEISKLVTTSTAANGLKISMTALIRSENIDIDSSLYQEKLEEICGLYSLSIDKLESSIYGRLSVYHQYCKFLLKHNLNDRFKKIHKEATKLSKIYQFTYWTYELERLVNPSIPAFKEINNNNPFGIDSSEYINKFIKRNKKKIRPTH
ncbi:hypothetical protein CWO27_03650 [Vibrio sp. 10N.286.51.C3]|uniref:SIR2 family protein n=1 Tax=unclassified Vibrio TaxID=2614977 RepID=UPI000D3D6DDB|nr:MULTISPECIES: SIR2 family protein [unclassified Vibrio]PTP16083.1 hypothetical protein CWO27_03650 [Vibrio sp. 10N.286.51.C3]TKE72913.1 hypothetical protein FCV45_04300 [Vibrio sp. F12]